MIFVARNTQVYELICIDAICMICIAGNTSIGYLLESLRLLRSFVWFVKLVIQIYELICIGNLLASFKIIKAICMICIDGNTNLITELYRIFTCLL